MRCPNCDKKYHWCTSCGYPEEGIACSYECAWSLYDQEKIDDNDMLAWAFVRIGSLESRLRAV